MISDNDLVKLILGFKIKHLRLQKKVSYQELSQATGLSVSYLNDIEKGKKYPKPDKIRVLAQA
ncbi:MAG: transcriptional regulator with XRE-family HTH domain, partial [Cyclobacteriaceae bacterium]